MKSNLHEGNRLTERQREVLTLLALGKKTREVGHILNISTRTVQFHKYRIMEMLEAANFADLIKYAVSNHLIDT